MKTRMLQLAYRENSVVDAESTVHLSRSTVGDFRDEDARVTRYVLVVVATGYAEPETCV